MDGNLTMFLSLVIYRPRWAEIQRLVDSLRPLQAEFSGFAVLVSGSAHDANRAREILGALTSTKVRIIHRYDNLGFAAGHNLLLNEGFSWGEDLAVLVNPDLVFSAGALAELGRRVQAIDQPVLASPILARRADGGDVGIDSAGIHWTADARHFDRLQGRSWNDRPTSDQVVEGVSGACMLVRHDAWKEITQRTGEFFDAVFLAYREDADLGVRAAGMGIQSLALAVDGVEHYRAISNGSRTSTAVNLLSVQNRLLMRWRLGRQRPGNPVRASFRDLLVVGAALLVERSSWPGVASAFRLRRYYKSRSRSDRASLPN